MTIKRRRLASQGKPFACPPKALAKYPPIRHRGDTDDTLLDVFEAVTLGAIVVLGRAQPQIAAARHAYRFDKGGKELARHRAGHAGTLQPKDIVLADGRVHSLGHLSKKKAKQAYYQSEFDKHGKISHDLPAKGRAAYQGAGRSFDFAKRGKTIIITVTASLLLRTAGMSRSAGNKTGS